MTKVLKQPATSAPTIPIKAIVRVGDGRGFIVGTDNCRYIITAAHCIPQDRHPRPHLANSTPELILPNLIGPLSKRAKLNISGELCAISLTDDIAAICSPDEQELPEQADTFESFTSATMTVGLPPPPVPSYQWRGTPGTPAWVLSLDGKWMPSTFHSNGRFLVTGDAPITSGMSGSPIVDASGAAIGLVSTGSKEHVNPSLADCLPPWLWRKIAS